MEAISSTIQTNTVTPTASLGAARTTTRAPIEPTVQPNPIEKPVSKEAVQQAIDEISSNLGNTNESIGFSYEEKLGQLFVLVTDNESGEVIREVPSKDFIKHKLAMQEMIGLLLDRQV